MATCFVDDIIIFCRNLEILTLFRDELLDAIARSNFVINVSKSSDVVDHIEVFNLEIGHRSLRVKDEKFASFIEDMYHSNDNRRMALVRYV